MRITLIIALFASFFNVYAQSVSVATGGSSVDVNVNSVQSGKLYYILSKTTVPSFTAQQIKDLSISGSANILSKGKVIIGGQDVNQSLVQTITGLQANNNFFVYTSFEPENGSVANAKETAIKTSERFQKASYNSQIPALNNKNLEYLIYKTESYLKDASNKNFPVLFFFHGDGEKRTGTNTIDLLKVSPGLTKLIQDGRNVDFLVVSVQMPVSLTWITAGWLNELVEKVKATNRIDGDKIYVSGYSGGGGGMYHLTATQPEKIAAFVPVAGVNSFWVDKTMSYSNLKNIPEWAFHGQNDNTVTINNMNEPIRQVGLLTPASAVSAITTIYTDSKGGHGSIPFYAYNTEELYSWLISKSKLSATNTAPVISAAPSLAASTGSSIVINAGASDSNGIIAYDWIKTSGPDITMEGKNSANVELKNLSAGTYTFHLLVTDGLKSTSFKNITLLVTGSGIAANVAPTVSAGTDKNIISPLTGLTINGTASDVDGSISSYNWTQTDGPNLCILNGSQTKDLQATGLVIGKYTFRLSVKDNAGASQSDDMVVNVTSTVVTTSIIIPSGDYAISFPEGLNINKWKNKALSEFYASTIKLQVQANDSKNVSSVEYTLNGVTSKDQWADKDAVNGKFNYQYSFYALATGSYTVQITVNENSGNKITSEVSFTISSAGQARMDDSNEQLISVNNTYQVYTLNGLVVKEGQGQLDTNTLAQGIYIVKSGNETKRILVD
ncbi:MAG: hypothetical protein H7329_10820 [Opitutaceae bacterium]|nr:hypothetical protein [Cytophagales bacterium]